MARFRAQDCAAAGGAAAGGAAAAAGSLPASLRMHSRRRLGATSGHPSQVMKLPWLSDPLKLAEAQRPGQLRPRLGLPGRADLNDSNDGV